MPRSVILLAIGLVLGIGFGFLLGAGTGRPMPDNAVHDHSAHDHGQGSGPQEMTETTPPHPKLVLAMHPDGPQSRNLHIGVTGFAFAPEAVNGPHVPGQGHAHIYVNDIKIARAYGPWIQLSALPKGTHTVRVTLNANDHSQLATGGIPIEASTEITID